jgi:O-acetyl-ADP-ribose deacetylase (regulator of RNase III)/transcriptional regulator with XRE-family HTH domain
MPFQIIRNDITRVKADAIVNTANPSVTVGDGVDRAIYEAAGWDDLIAARQQIGELPVGEAGITPAYNLKAKYIIHSSGPMWNGGTHNEKKLLRQCYDRSLELAYENKCKSIAFPLMATGTYAFPKELGLQIAVDSFKKFLEDHEMAITLVVFTEYAYKVSGDIYDEVESFINGAYVDDALESEYKVEGIPKEQKRFEAPLEEPMLLKAPQEKQKRFKAPQEKQKRFEAPQEKQKRSAAPLEEPKYFETYDAAPIGEKKDLDSKLKDIYTDTFARHMQQLINKKGLKNSEVYAAANISKQYFSKLLKGQVKPSKEKVLALAVGLQLNLDETVDFLQLAGYALSPISQTDAVVEYFIENQDYNVMKIDIVLFDYGLDPLSKG